jgi:hypothetical protein
MKESELVQIKNKVERLGALVQMLLQDFYNVKDLSIGTLELVKKFPEYENAVEALKSSLVEAKEEETKLET